jgi:alkanesulfonate monooxygenase SsuD/methylene tetrahydromethanopterin reductase-like flavin-dependent oxidoreductase (luciferase family)
LSFDGTVFDRAPANVKVVIGKHTYLAESEEAAKELRNLFVDM